MDKKTEETTPAKKMPLKKRFCIIDKYGLAPLITRYVLECGSRATWTEIKDKLEDHVVAEHGVEITLHESQIIKYYDDMRKTGRGMDEVGEHRRGVSEEWVRSLQAIYDQVGDLKVLLEHSFQNRNASEYTALSKSLNEIFRLLADIHKEANVNQIVRDKIVSQIHLFIDIIKEYNFEDLKTGLTGQNVIREKNTGSNGSQKRGKVIGLSENKITEMKTNLIRHIISQLPHVSDMFVQKKAEDVQDKMLEGVVGG